MRRLSANLRSVADFFLSLLNAAIPALGVLGLVSAVISLDLVGYRGEIVLNSLLELALLYFSAAWLSAQIFVRHDPDEHAVMILDADNRAEGRFYARGIAVMIWLLGLISALARLEQYSDAVRSVLALPAVAIMGLMLIRLGALIHRAGTDVHDDDAPLDFRRTLIRNLGLGTMLVALLGSLAAAAGYVAVPSFVLIPLCSTLALIGLIAVLQQFGNSLYCLVFGKDDKAASEDLIPVLIGLLLTIASIPLFALIWGARQSDLSEAWTKFLNGFSIGATHVSPVDFLIFAVVFAVGYVLTRVVQGTLRVTVLPKTRIDPGGQNAIISGIGYVGIFLAALLAITTTGIDLSGLALVAGALTVGIGFGLQNIVQNFVAGIIMLIERPVAIGDWIEVGNYSGIVRDIAVRATRIETFDKTDVIVPNGEFISGTVTNWTRYSHLGRVILPVKVAHGNDSRKVEKILMEVAESHPGVSARHKPVVALVSIDDAMKFEIRVIIKDVNQMLVVKSDLAHDVLRRFSEAALVAPIPQREIFVHDRRDPPAPDIVVVPAKPAPTKPTSSRTPRKKPNAG